MAVLLRGRTMVAPPLSQYNRHGIAVGSPVYFFSIARTAVVVRRHSGDGGATAVLVRCHGGHGGAAASPLRIRPTRGGTTEVLNMLKVSAVHVPPRRSAVLTVFRGATAISDGTSAEPRRSWRCHCGLCRTSTAVAPRLRCDGGITLTLNLNLT